jgi:hypothetical protein
MNYNYYTVHCFIHVLFQSVCVKHKIKPNLSRATKLMQVRAALASAPQH